MKTMKKNARKHSINKVIQELTAAARLLYYILTELHVSRRVSVSRHVFECLGLVIPMSRLGLGP